MGYKVTCSRCEKSISHECGSVEPPKPKFVSNFSERVKHFDGCECPTCEEGPRQLGTLKHNMCKGDAIYESFIEPIPRENKEEEEMTRCKHGLIAGDECLCGEEPKSDFIIKGIEFRIHPSGKVKEKKVVAKQMDAYRPMYTFISPMFFTDGRPPEGKAQHIYPEPRVINLKKSV